MLIIYDLDLVDIFNFSNSPNNRYIKYQIHISPHFQNAYAWCFRTYVIYLC